MSEENPYAAPSADVTQTHGNEVELASRLARFGGAFVDGILITIIFIPLMMLTGYWERAVMQQQSVLEIAMLALIGISIFLTINGYLLAKRGQTVGKIVAKTRIVSYETNELLPFHKVFGLRYLPFQIVAQLGAVGSIATLVNALFIFRADRRCLHDLIAGTKVVKTG